MKMKYVMFDSIFPVIWYGPMNHCDARLLCAIDGKELQPTSAGFVEIVDGRFICSGESDTLGMKPAPEDAELLAKSGYVMRHDIRKVKNPTLAERILGTAIGEDPTVLHTFRVPLSIKLQIITIGNKRFIKLLSDLLLKKGQC